MSDEPRRMLGSERGALVDALVAAFPSASALDELVKTRFNPVPGTDLWIPSLNTVSTERHNLPEHAGALIDYFASRDLVDTLIREAHAKQPYSQTLRRIHDAYFASIQRQVSRQLERKVLEHSRFLDPASWREELERAEQRVCRIETATSLGTGFLVAADMILTNYHVLHDVIEGPTPAASVTVQFDVKRIPGCGLTAGPTFGLHAQWCLAKSKPSRLDTVVGSHDGEPTVDELDFALVRLAGNPGHEALASGKRGWFPLASTPPEIVEGAGVLILQYPKDLPLKLAPPERYLGMNSNATRMRYETLTDEGSSGSPCFTTDLRVIALHHSGDPDFARQARYNEGIPTHTIAAALPADARTLVTTPVGAASTAGG